MIILIIAVTTAYLLGLFFLYRHWLNTPPDGFRTSYADRSTAVADSKRIINVRRSGAVASFHRRNNERR
jgi:hypothetical protein